MHNAPSVSCPVGRSRFHGTCLVVASVTGLAAGLLWRQQAEPAAWQQILLALVWLGSSIAALLSWRGSPAGTLQWDGQSWHWDDGVSVVAGHITVQLDLQRCLLLLLRADNGSAPWLWLERGGDAIAWDAVRRAVLADVPAGLAPAARVVDQSVS